jgi:hypothetical protein
MAATAMFSARQISLLPRHQRFNQDPSLFMDALQSFIPLAHQQHRDFMFK